MDIKYIGHSSFYVRSKDARLITDPFDPQMVGLKFPKQEADVITISHGHADHNYTQNIDGEPLIVDWPGQFEKKEIRVAGFKSYHDKKKGEERGENTLYRIDADGISILHCGDLGFVPEDSFLDEIGEIDILMVPVGGTYTIDATEAVELVKKIEPAIVIPMHYQVEGMEKKFGSTLAPVSEFLKKIGHEKVQPIPKLTVKPEELDEEMKVVVLQVGG